MLQAAVGEILKALVNGMGYGMQIYSWPKLYVNCNREN